MFDGMPEQFYQFLASTTTSRTVATNNNNNTTTTASSLQLPLSFSLHNHNHHHASFPSYSQPPQQPPPPPPPQPPGFDTAYHLLHHNHHFLSRNNSQVVSKVGETLNLEHDNNGIPRSLILHDDIPWSNDELLALFRIRSSMDNTWFPDFIWENVSRKLSEIGFKRSAEKCKEKFEEETRTFNSNIISNTNKNNNTSNNNYRLFGELEELCNNNTTNNNHTISHVDHDNHDLPPPPPPPPPPLPPPPPIVAEPEHPESSSSERDECGGESENQDGDDSQVKEDTKNDSDNDNNNVEEEHESMKDDDSEKTEENTKKVMRKRKRQKKFEMFKGFCEQIVSKMMVQQEQLHCKILQDMVRRDEEKIAKEEAWKKQEFERLQKELDIRAHEQAIVGDRQAKILDCLNKFNNLSSTSSSNILDTQFLKETLENLNKVPSLNSLSNSSNLTNDVISAQLLPITSCTITTTTTTTSHQICPDIPTSSSSENVTLLSPITLDNSKISIPMSSPSMDQDSQNPNNALKSHNNDLSSQIMPLLVSSHNTSKLDHNSPNVTHQTKQVGKDDTGRRWPRDEVLALINIRCNLFNENNSGGGGGGGEAPNDRESFSKAPLWERISQKMAELGYKRSAKRCKEKWENINKYFRKTKDLNKKRSIDSRTCPYFHQLSHLYNQGTLVVSSDRPVSPYNQETILGSSDRPVSHPGSPESNRSMTLSGPQGESSTPNVGATNNTMHVSQGNTNEGVVQVPGFDFEF